MVRYCTICREDYEFEPRAFTGTADLICPKCGNVIPKNSRHPMTENEKSAEAVGGAYLGILRIAYLFYLVLAVIGVIGYVIHSNPTLYVVTAVAVVCYLLQFITGTTPFRTGIIFLPIGGIAGYLILHSLPGVCMGILIVFLIRHIIRDLFFTLIRRLIEAGS